MKVNNSDNGSTVQVSFRLDSELVRRLRMLTQTPAWPPPPSQTEIVERGIKMVLDDLKAPEVPGKRRLRARAEA